MRDLPSALLDGLRGLSRRGPRLALAGLLAAASAAPLPARAEETPSQIAPSPSETPAARPSQSATAHAQAAEAGGFEAKAEGLLEFHARGIDVAEAFAQLRRLLKRNIVVAPDVRARFTGDLYGVTPAQAIDAICRSAGLVARDADGFLYVEPATVETRLFRLSHARAKDVAPLVRQFLSPLGQVGATESAQRGIKPNQDDAGGDDYAAGETLVVSDLPRQLDAVAAAIRVLDARPSMILMEATLVAATIDDSTQMGIELTALAGIDFRRVDPSSQAGLDLGLGELPRSQFDRTTVSAATDLFSTLSRGGLSFGLLKEDVAAFVRALKTVTDVQVTANPKVMVLNKQRGEVIVGRRDGYLTTTTTQTSTEQKVEFLETGTRLLFRPFIGEDRMVRLEIHPEDSNGGVTPAGLPFKETVEVTTNVLVPDGRTIVIGGLFRDRSVVTETKVPVLGDVPLLGSLFSSTTDTKMRQEIFILLTPRIVEPEHAEEATAPAGRRPAAGGRLVGPR